MFILEKSQGNLINVYKYLAGQRGEELGRGSQGLLSGVQGQYKRQQAQAEIQKYIRKNFFTVRVVECWNTLSGECCGVSSPGDTEKSSGHSSLTNLLQLTLISAGRSNLMIWKLNYSVIL